MRATLTVAWRGGGCPQSLCLVHCAIEILMVSLSPTDPFLKQLLYHAHTAAEKKPNQTPILFTLPELAQFSAISCSVFVTLRKHNPLIQDPVLSQIA